MTRIRLVLMFYFSWLPTKLHANPVEGLEVCEDMVEILLVLEIRLTEDS